MTTRSHGAAALLGRHRIPIAGVVGAMVLLSLAWTITSQRRSGIDHASGPGEPAMSGMAGMDMGSGEARLTDGQLRQLGITFGTVEERVLTEELRTVGIVAVDETRVTQLSPKFAGYVERLHVNYTGQDVRRGAPLATIYSPDLLAAQEELLLALRLDATTGVGDIPGLPASGASLADAARRRLELAGISNEEIDDIVRSGRARRALTLHSPASGVVTEKMVVEGQSVQAGQPLYTIADLRSVWVEAELREGQASFVRPGTGADIELAGRPGRTVKGRVEFLHPVLDPGSRTVRARVVVANTEGLLRPGMFASVRLSTPGRTALTIPASAVIRTGTRSVVFVDMGDGRFIPEEIEIGSSAGDLVEVLAGLEPGQQVVTSAQFMLDSESNLAEVMRTMVGQMGAGGMDSMDMGPPTTPGMPTDRAPAESMDVKGADVRRLPGVRPSTPPK